MAGKEKQLGPKMWFHPVNGSYVVCNTFGEVPDGFIEDISDCTNPVLDKFEGPARCTDFKIMSKGGTSKNKDKKGSSKNSPKGPTLKSLKLSRKEAEEILVEDKVKFDADAEDAVIASLVSDLLE